MDTDTDGTGSTTATDPSGPATSQSTSTSDPGNTTVEPSTSSTTSASTTPTTDPSTSGSEGDDSGGSSSTGEGFVGSLGCGTKATLPEGDNTFSIDDRDRRYVLRYPSNYDPQQPWPLIFALHGNNGNPGYWDSTDGSRNIRDAFAEEAILVIPEAIDNQWRNYSAEPETWPGLMDLELNYFDAILESVSNDLCIHPDQVFSMGFSGGGSFSGVLGCRRDYIRAIAVGGSVIYFEEEDCTESHGSWITIGDGELTSGREAFRDFFRDRGGCEPESTPVEPEGCIAYEGCDLETPVTFCSHPGDHVWPSIGTDATRDFFRQFYQGE